MPCPRACSRPRRLEPGRFFGTTRREVRTRDLILSETLYPASLRVPRHTHEMAYFCLLLDGGYWERYGSRQVDYGPMSVAFHPPHDDHFGDIAPAGTRSFNVELAPAWVERLREHGPVPAESLDRHSGELVQLGLRLYREFRRGEVAIPLVTEGLVLEMLGTLARLSRRDDTRAPAWLTAAVERIREECEQPWTLGRLARELDVHPVRLARAFRRFRNESAGDCLRRARIERACRRLHDEPDLPLVDLAAEVGFADQSHFTRVFRRETGFTPGDWRRLGPGDRPGPVSH